MSQLTFDLPVREARGRADFFVSPSNAAALALLDGWRDWPLRKMVLVGPQGAGKTHLAHVWAAMANARVVKAAELQASGVPDLASAPAVVVEDADQGNVDETAFFHLYNLLAENGCALLTTARTPPRDWNLTLPDLLSRMSAAPVAQLDAPDDALLQAVILKQFADRQLTVSPPLINWLLARIDRSFAAAANAVDVLDSAALAKRRPVNMALARDMLDKLTATSA